MKAALHAGFTHVDSAEGYQTEEGTGRAIKSFRVMRDAIYVTTKLFPGFKKLGVPDKNYHDTIATLIQEAHLPCPEANQVEYHLLCNRTGLTDYMLKNGIAPVAYSSLAPLSSWRIEEGQGGEVFAELRKESQRVISDITKKINVSEAKLLLRWGLQQGYAVLTKSSKAERIRQNLELFDFEIAPDDMHRMNQWIEPNGVCPSAERQMSDPKLANELIQSLRSSDFCLASRGKLKPNYPPVGLEESLR